MINYPKAVSHAATFLQASSDPRWNESERAALASIAHDDLNAGKMSGKGRIYEANGMKFYVRFAVHGCDLSKKS
jgi:hypothetical protein